jgi:hypothetical protein
VLRVARRQDASAAREALDRAGFVARLLEFRRGFGQTPRVKLSLMALTPTARTDFNSLWNGTCLLRMWGEKDRGQPREVVLHMHYRVARPSAEGFARGGWLHFAAITQSLVAEATRPLMREVAAQRGIDTWAFHDNWLFGGKRSVTGGVYLGDYDRDGRIDMLVTDVNAFVLYRGLEDGKFLDVTTEVGLPKHNRRLLESSGTAAFADLDGDGWDDLVLTDQVFRNEEGRTFALVSPLSNLRLSPRDAGIAVADFDRDGRLDLYVTTTGLGETDSWLSGRGGGASSNRLLHNLGHWQFEDVTASSGASGGNRSTFTAVWLDADNDGWPDLYVPNEFGNGVLLVNRRDGTFHQHALVDHPADFGTMGITCGDLDNDGQIDIYAANMYSKAGNRVIGNLRSGSYPPEIMATMRTFSTGSQLHHNRGGLRFEQLGARWQVADVGWAYGAALADLDNDGWLDLAATCGYISQDRSKPDG